MGTILFMTFYHLLSKCANQSYVFDPFSDRCQVDHRLPPVKTRPRQPVGLPKLLLAIGGQAPKAIKSVEGYDFAQHKWVQISEMQTRR